MSNTISNNSTCSSEDASVAAVDRLLHRLNHGASSLSADSSSSPTTTATTIRPLSPHLQSQYDALHKELENVLLMGRSNGSAFLLGPPASGKRIVLNQVLQTLRAAAVTGNGSNSGSAGAPSFRQVTIDGRVLPGHLTGKVVREILRQLTESALIMGKNHDEDSTTADKRKKKASKKNTHLPVHQQQQDSQTTTTKTVSFLHQNTNSNNKMLLRFRKTGSFLSHMDLLDQILQVASMDHGQPVLIVLHHVETFLYHGSSSSSSSSNANNNNATNNNSNNSNNNNNPQLLLYHLLDRIGRADSGLALVATSTHSGLLTLLEKRIQSRVHGSTRCIHFGSSTSGGSSHLSSWEASSVQAILVDALVHVKEEQDEDDDEHDMSCLQQLKDDIARILIAPAAAATSQIGETNNNNNGKDASLSSSSSSSAITLDNECHSVRATLQRAMALGKDVRWFTRVASLALSMYREDCRRRASTTTAAVTNTATALLSKQQQQQHYQRHTPHYWLEALRDMGATIVSTSATTSNSFQLSSIRKQSLASLSGPQVVLLLAARRILVRDTQKEDDNLIILTFDRIVQEYRRYRGPSNRYSLIILRKALQELIQLDIIRPAMDQCGTGPWQFQSKNIKWDVHTMARVPLQITYDMRTELKVALEGNVVFENVVSTALCEWAKKLS
jgi:hypothetical protein